MKERPHLVVFSSRGAMAHFEDGRNEFYKTSTPEYCELLKDRMPTEGYSSARKPIKI